MRVALINGEKTEVTKWFVCTVLYILLCIYTLICNSDIPRWIYAKTEDAKAGWYTNLYSPRPIRERGGLRPAGEICANHGKGGTKAPPQLRPIDSLPEFCLPVVTKLVAEPKEGVHESQVEAPDRSALQLFHDRIV